MNEDKKVIVSEKSLKNLKPFNKMTPEEHKRLSSKGGTNSAKNKKERKKFREEVLIALSSENVQGNMVAALIKRSMALDNTGNKAFEIVRDTIGEKPDNVNINKNIDENNEYKNLSVEELKKLAGE